jgi:3-hydroxybutyryl-CoA dehydrogenase
LLNEAVFCVMEGAKPEDVDAGMKLGCNFPMGPLELLDFVGLDVALATITGLYDNLRDSKYRPCPLFVKMVEAGRLGRKTGRGFYAY